MSAVALAIRMKTLIFKVNYKNKLVHFGGIHFSALGDKKENYTYLLNQIGSGYSLCKYALWNSGIAYNSSENKSLSSLLESKVRWIGREEGTGSKLCQDLVLPKKKEPKQTCKDHKSVVNLISQGFIDAGISQEYIAKKENLKLFTVRKEIFELCYPTNLENSFEVKKFLEIIRSHNYRDTLNKQTNYNTKNTGEITHC